MDLRADACKAGNHGPAYGVGKDQDQKPSMRAARKSASSSSRSPKMAAAQAVLLLAGHVVAQCPDYVKYSTQRHEPFSTGRYGMSYMRPPPECRTFRAAEVEDVVDRMKKTIADPDLARLFENAFPNTLDTAIKWHGVAADDPSEELTFVITGDIDAMWLRDSANQLQSYMPVLKANSSKESIAGLFRGVINLQARYLLTSPYCNSFQAPVESKIPPAVNNAAKEDTVKPQYSNSSVFECKYELDSLAAFLQISVDYYNKTQDADFFGKHKWSDAVRATLKVARDMQTPTYGPDGQVLASPYMFTRVTPRATETLTNDGAGSPVGNGTGLIRSAFRPSDDSTLFQLFIPANMMFAANLGAAAEIAAKIGGGALADEMRTFSKQLRDAITAHGIIPDTTNGGIGVGRGNIYAFEVDGFGSAAVMDDANIPSLLSAPLSGYVSRDDPVYRNTRAVVLNERGVNDNPYFMRGPVINAIGGPHAGPGKAWPMASIVRILTSDDDDEITRVLKEVVSSTDGLGLIHESINAHNQSDWTRQWFSWANGLFGQMIIDLEGRKPDILKKSFQ
ncbi:hypothetical protein PoMZ_02658 [Pyricularia oryzae]|nr:hypothetical protein PoMZ_02658 [Pyricularia oryzae]